MPAFLERLGAAIIVLAAGLTDAPMDAFATRFQSPIVSPTYPNPAPNPRLSPRLDPLPVIRFVDLDGHRMRLRVGGLEHIGKRPAVIFEAGGTDRLESWDGILREVTAFAPAVAYDRPGNGESAPDGHPPTPAHVAERLHALLAAVRVPPPYVLVGHSWGGPLIRMFAGLYPTEVAGLVYVDPTDLRSEEEDRAYLQGQGFTAETGARHRADMYARMIAAGGELKVIGEVSAGYFKEFRSVPLPDVPVTVLASDRFDPTVWGSGPCAPRQCHDFATRFRAERLMAMTRAVTSGTFILATGRGHSIHKDDPALVLSVIQRMAAAASTSSRSP